MISHSYRLSSSTRPEHTDQEANHRGLSRVAIKIYLLRSLRLDVSLALLVVGEGSTKSSTAGTLSTLISVCGNGMELDLSLGLYIGDHMIYV